MLKLTVFWGQRSSRLVGWSENFWSRQFTTITPSAIEGAKKLVALCYACKGKQTTNVGYRLSTWNANGTPTKVSQLFDVPLEGDNPNIKDADSSDYPTVAYLLAGASLDPVRRTQQWFRGIVDDTIVDGGQILKPLLNQQRKDILKELGLNWGIRVRNPNIPAPVGLATVSAQNGIISTTTPHGLVVNDRVVVMRTEVSPRTSPSPNGTWTVGSTPSNLQFSIVGWNYDTDSGVFVTRRSQMQKVTFAVVAATWEFTRATSRQVGRPFGSPSGRRKRVNR